MSNVVDISGVTVKRDGNLLLDSVDWLIGADERWILFGANGSGKTTLMEVVSTYLGPSRGSVRILGEDRGKADMREVRARIGYVGPGPATYVRGNFRSLDIVITGKHASFVGTQWHEYNDEDWVLAQACLDLMRAGHLAERRFSTMSEGEKKRVLIARSLVTQPELLLLDEPGSGLDLGARERLVEALSSMVGDPIAPAAVLVTHHVEEIPPGFDHILVLAHGAVIGSGRVEEVLTSETLSAAFEMPLQLERTGRRYRALRLLRRFRFLRLRSEGDAQSRFWRSSSLRIRRRILPEALLGISVRNSSSRICL